MPVAKAKAKAKQAHAPSIEELFEVGGYFGHSLKRSHPKMKPFIIMTREKVSIIDLEKTCRQIERALKELKRILENDGLILFVGTKRQAKDRLAELATALSQPYVNERWIGGLLTNYGVVRDQLAGLDRLEKERAEGAFEKLTKREVGRIDDRILKLEANLGGLRRLTRLPDALFVVDSRRESIAVKEAKKLKIPVFALTDTDADPGPVDRLIVVNDDSTRSVDFVLKGLKETLLPFKPESVKGIGEEE